MNFIISLIRTYLLTLIGSGILVYVLLSVVSGRILHSPWFWLTATILCIQIGIALFRASLATPKN